MGLDDRYSRILDQMEAAADAGMPCDWARCRRLVEEALSIIDGAGQGHTKAGLGLSEALLAIEAQPSAQTAYMDDRAFAFN